MRHKIPLLAALLFCFACLFLGAGATMLWIDSQSSLPQAPQIEDPVVPASVLESNEEAEEDTAEASAQTEPADDTSAEEAEDAQPEGDPVMDLTDASLAVSVTREAYEDSTMRLVIPKLEIDLPVLDGTSVATLLRGIGLYDGAQLPTEDNANVSIAGHRNDIRHGKVIDTYPFYRLNTLTEGDCLYLVYQDQIYQYQWEGTWVIAPKTGVTVYQNAKASIDASNLSEGYVYVKYTGGKNVKIKVQITKSGGTTYTYNLNNAGTTETFPLTEGNGSYSIKVYENTSGTKYALAYSTTVDMQLRNDFLPFLYPNQYVNFTSSSKVVAKAAELTSGKKDDLSKVSAIYYYVTDNFTYDYDLAATVQSGYLPDVDQVLASKKGICFDYAAVMASMLRSQNIPCKLVVGYAGTVYHAWIDVFIDGVGWVDKAIYFDGKDWTMMDPTFVSTGKHSEKILSYVTNDANYTQKYAY